MHWHHQHMEIIFPLSCEKSKNKSLTLFPPTHFTNRLEPEYSQDKAFTANKRTNEQSKLIFHKRTRTLDWMYLMRLSHWSRTTMKIERMVMVMKSAVVWYHEGGKRHFCANVRRKCERRIKVCVQIANDYRRYNRKPISEQAGMILLLVCMQNLGVTGKPQCGAIKLGLGGCRGKIMMIKETAITSDGIEQFISMIVDS